MAFQVSFIINQQMQEPQTKEFYSKMLQLEDDLLAACSKEVVSQLINCYARCVEFFDRQNNPVSFYFSEKILHTLSRQTILKAFCTKETVKTKAPGSRDVTPIRRQARMIKANIAIECSKDMKASEKLLESAKAQLSEQRTLITHHIDQQREQVERKISEKRFGKSRRLKSEPATNSTEELSMSQLSQIADHRDNSPNNSYIQQQLIANLHFNNIV